MNELGGEELQKLIGFFMQHGEFDYICVDCGQRFSKREEILFQISHKVVVVYSLERSQDDISLIKDYFSRFEGFDFVEKIVHVGNKYNYGAMVDEIDDKKYSYIIDFDRDSFTQRLGDDPSLDLDFGKGVKLLSMGLT